MMQTVQDMTPMRPAQFGEEDPQSCTSADRCHGLTQMAQSETPSTSTPMFSLGKSGRKRRAPKRHKSAEDFHDASLRSHGTLRDSAFLLPLFPIPICDFIVISSRSVLDFQAVLAQPLNLKP
eukprot:2917008-Pyramimonas_sp.AAC.3